MVTEVACRGWSSVRVGRSASIVRQKEFLGHVTSWMLREALRVGRDDQSIHGTHPKAATSLDAEDIPSMHV